MSKKTLETITGIGSGVENVEIFCGREIFFSKSLVNAVICVVIFTIMHDQ